MNELFMPATDTDVDIGAKLRDLLAPYTPEQRRDILMSFDRQLDAQICANEGHKGIGYPGCPACAPSTIAALRERGIDW